MSQFSSLALTARAASTSGLVMPEIRFISPADEVRLEQFGAHLSLSSRYQRFFSPRGFMPGEVRRLTDPDPGLEVALVATIEASGGERIVGVARYAIDRLDDSAELAVVVADEWQQRGVGRLLLGKLLAHAEQHGIHALKGVTLATNWGMQRLALSMGFALHRASNEAGVIELRKHLALAH